jgi:AcrR family transcriptional regulator
MKTSADPSQDTRHRLLMAAIQVFAQKGFDAAGIREIAQLAGANSALIHYHFGGKEGLCRAAIRFMFEEGPTPSLNLPPPPAPGDPEAAARARASLRGFLRSFLEAFLAGGFDKDFPEDLKMAANLFWIREVMNPVPSRIDLIMGYIRPYIDHLDACLKALRPDLDPDALFLMASSVQAQIMFFHQEGSIIRLVRGRAFGPGDVDRLVDHILAFSLGGLGLSPLAAEPPGEGG